MNAVMHDVAGAALPVAVGLLVLTALARATLSEQVEDAKLQRTGRQYLDALSTWCLVAALVDAVAVGLSGALGVVAIAAPAAIAVAAAVLREPEEELVRVPEARAAQTPPAPPAPVPDSLWAERDADAAPRLGLWSGS